eukprot:3426838-Pyramimonas_sp.AAC.1
MGVPAPLPRAYRAGDVVTAFQYYANGRGPRCDSVMNAPPTPDIFGPGSFSTPAGLAKVSARCVGGPGAPDILTPDVLRLYMLV